MARVKRHITPAFTGTLIAFIDFFALLGQQQFFVANVERLRQPTLADLSLVATGEAGKKAQDIALVTVSVDRDGSIHVNDDPDPVTLEAIAGRLAPLKAQPGVAYLYGDAGAGWGVMLAVQREMASVLERNIVTPIVQAEDHHDKA